MAERQEKLAIIVTAQNLASKALKQVSKDLGGLERAVPKAAGQAAHGVRTSIGNIQKMGLILAGAGIAATTAAERIGIDYEDAFAGVRKTVDATDPELQKIYADLKALSTRIPIKFTDLAGIAQEAGALGVATNDVVKFTDVVSRLSAATVGLSTEAAAEAFGKLGNVLHVSGVGFERMGSSLVALGNAGASSEADIVEVAKRFGAAGAQAHLSAAEVLGFSSAIASMGVEPEAAGSSLSRVFNNITKYIATGNDKIKSFAKVSGVSVKTFSDLFRKDAAGGVELFLQKLGKMDRFAASKALKDAGITNVRDINAVLLLSQNYGELKRQVDLSTKAYKDNTELQAVSEKRFDTLKSHLMEFVNTGMNAADTFSQGLSPAIGEVAEKAKAFVLAHEADFKRLGQQAGDALRGVVAWGEKLDWKGIESALQGAVGFAKGIVDAFANAPPWVQQAVLTGWGLNKLSGGALVDVTATLTKGALGTSLGKLSGVFARGGSVAAPMYVKEVGIGGAAGTGGGGFGALKFVSGALLITGTVAVLWDELGKVLASNDEQTAANKTAWAQFLKTGTSAELESAMKGIKESYQPTLGWGTPLDMGAKSSRDELVAMYEAEMARRATDTRSETAATDRAVQASYAAMDSWETHSESLRIAMAGNEAATAANTAALQAEHKKAKEAVGGSGAGFHDFLLRFRTGGAAVAIKNFPKEFHYLQTASDTLKASKGYQAGIRQNITAMQRAMVGATAEQKRKLSADIVALRRLLVPTNAAVVTAVGAGAATVAAAVNDIHFLAGGANAGDKADWVKYPVDGYTHARGIVGMARGATSLGVAGEAGDEAVAIIRHPQPINAAAARELVIHATFIIPPVTIDPRGAAHGNYRFEATVLGKAG